MSTSSYFQFHSRNSSTTPQTVESVPQVRNISTTEFDTKLSLLFGRLSQKVKVTNDVRTVASWIAKAKNAQNNTLGLGGKVPDGSSFRHFFAIHVEKCAEWWLALGATQHISVIELCCPYMGVLVYHVHKGHTCDPLRMLFLDEQVCFVGFDVESSVYEMNKWMKFAPKRAFEIRTIRRRLSCADERNSNVIPKPFLRKDSSKTQTEFTGFAVKGAVMGEHEREPKCFPNRIQSAIYGACVGEAATLKEAVAHYCPHSMRITLANTPAGVGQSNWSRWPLTLGQVNHGSRNVFLVLICFMVQMNCDPRDKNIWGSMLHKSICLAATTLQSETCVGASSLGKYPKHITSWQSTHKNQQTTPAPAYGQVNNKRLLGSRGSSQQSDQASTPSVVQRGALTNHASPGQYGTSQASAQSSQGNFNSGPSVVQRGTPTSYASPSQHGASQTSQQTSTPSSASSRSYKRSKLDVQNFFSTATPTRHQTTASSQQQVTTPLRLEVTTPSQQQVTTPSQQHVATPLRLEVTTPSSQSNGQGIASNTASQTSNSMSQRSEHVSTEALAQNTTPMEIDEETNLETSNDNTEQELPPQRTSSRRNTAPNNYQMMLNNRNMEPPNFGKKKYPTGSKFALKGINIVVSGVLDSMKRYDFNEYVQQHGGTLSKNVTKKVTHLVTDHGHLGPAKKSKCDRYNIPIVGEQFILDLVANSITNNRTRRRKRN